MKILKVANKGFPTKQEVSEKRNKIVKDTIERLKSQGWRYDPELSEIAMTNSVYLQFWKPVTEEITIYDKRGKPNKEMKTFDKSYKVRISDHDNGARGLDFQENIIFHV